MLSAKDRITGAFVGLCFGSGVNPRFSPMLKPEEARKRFGKRKFGNYGGYKTYGPRYKLWDQYTQSEMVCQMLLKYGEITPEIFRDYLLALHKKHNVFKGDIYGPSTQKAITKILAGEDIHEMGKTGITCGSAMRAMPIAMYFFGDRNKLLKNTVDSCIISHNTDVAIDAAIAVNVTLESLIKGMSKSDAIEEGLNATKKNHGKYGAKTDEPKIYERVQTALRILKGKSIDEAMGLIPEQIGVSWFARETIPGAFANYMVSESPEDSSLLSMRCGGDNNTVPEIACAFIGAEKGPEVFPKDVLKGIESVNHVKIMVMINKLLKKMGV